MIVTVYGKATCPKCLKTKEKLELKGIPFEWVDMAQVSAFRGHPRVVDAQVESVLRHEQLPMVLIGGHWFDYPEAMAELKRLGY